jgi:hypothetical protein
MGDQFVAGLWQSRIIEELCWYKGNPTMKTKEWIAPTWSWASGNDAVHISLLTKFHGEHSSRRLEAELIEHNVKAKASGELEYASIKIRCRLLHAVFKPTGALMTPRQDDQHVLELTDEEGNILKFQSAYFTGTQVVCFHTDEVDTEIIDPQCGYIAVIQRCLHERDSETADNIEHFKNEEGERGINGDEEDERSESGAEGSEYSLDIRKKRLSRSAVRTNARQRWRRVRKNRPRPI